MPLTTENRPSDSRLTHKQIAEQLGVSRQLVGFALRGEGRMSDEVRQQILEVARQNGYDQYSNREARSLIARRYGKRAPTGIIAVLFPPDFEGEPLSTVPFFIPFFAGLEAEAIRREVDLALCTLRPGRLPRLVKDKQVDGIICLATMPEDIASLSALQLPTVSLMYSSQVSLNLLIGYDDGMAQALAHLRQLGHERIAFFGPQFPPGQERLAGFRRELEAAGLFDPSLVIMADDYVTIAAGSAMMRELLEHQGIVPGSGVPLGFSALVAFNDLMAIGAIQVLQAAGYSVPQDVSVVGFDDVSLSYGFSPPLTSISFARSDMARRAVEFLCQPEETGSQTIADGTINEIYPVELVLRESTGPAPSTKKLAEVTF